MEKEIEVLNKSGLHARPAALFVQEANKYKCDIKVEKNGKQANAKSIIGLLSLGISHGSRIKIITKGTDEREAVEALDKLIESKFGEQ